MGGRIGELDEFLFGVPGVGRVVVDLVDGHSGRGKGRRRTLLDNVRCHGRGLLLRVARPVLRKPRVRGGAFSLERGPLPVGAGLPGRLVVIADLVDHIPPGVHEDE